MTSINPHKGKEFSVGKEKHTAEIISELACPLPLKTLEK